MSCNSLYSLQLLELLCNIYCCKDNALFRESETFCFLFLTLPAIFILSSVSLLFQKNRFLFHDVTIKFSRKFSMIAVRYFGFVQSRLLISWCGQFPESDSGCSCNVERVNAVGHRNAHHVVGAGNGFVGQSVALGTHDNGK